MKYIFLFTFLINFVLGFTQSIKFNKNYQDTSPVIRNIVVLDSGYVFVGGGGSPLSHLILTTDTLGNIKNTKKYTKQGYNLYHGLANSLKKADSSTYILAGSLTQSGANNNAVLLYKFNSLFDTIWTKTFMTDTNYSAAQDCFYFKNNYYLLGANYTGNNNTDFLLIKTDTSGNFIWKKNYGGYSYEQGFKISINNSLKILLGGSTRSFYTTTQLQRDWYLVQTDTAGNQLWHNHYGHPDYDDKGVNGLIATKDSGFLVSGNYVNFLWNEAWELYNGRLMKFNKNMEVEWDRQYSFGGSTIFKIVEEYENGDIAVLFNKIDTTTTLPPYIDRYCSGLLLIDSLGNEKWHRVYYPYNNDTAYTTVGILETVKKTHDNGFIMCGWSNQSGQPQQMWVVKTDSLGCDGYPPNCDTTNDISELLFHISDLNIFPNPALDFVSIATIQNLQNSVILITDLFGKTLHSEIIHKNTNYIKLNVQRFPRGVYVVCVTNKENKSIGKFVKY